MKKQYLLATAVMLFAWGLKAEMRQTPRGEPQALASADYGGVMYSTDAFGLAGTGLVVNYATACIPCGGVFYGAIFSSGTAGNYDFLDVWDASTAYNASLISPFARLYNVAGSTVTGIPNGAAAASGFVGPPKPIMFGKGLITRCNTAAYNMITTLFYSQDKIVP